MATPAPDWNVTAVTIIIKFLDFSSIYWITNVCKCLGHCVLEFNVHLINIEVQIGVHILCCRYTRDLSSACQDSMWNWSTRMAYTVWMMSFQGKQMTMDPWILHSVVKWMPRLSCSSLGLPSCLNCFVVKFFIRLFSHTLVAYFLLIQTVLVY